MLKPGEKGAIIQKDKSTYAIAPHIPCGIITPETMRKFADIAEKYKVQAMKITSATRIVFVGVREEDIDAIWSDLQTVPGAMVGLCVRSVKACPGSTYCRLGILDSLSFGLKLDAKYHGMKLPGKMKMAVSGCNLNCAEGWVRDIGLYGKNSGWALIVGGNVGPKPRIGVEIANGLSDERAMAAIEKIIIFYKDNANPGERIGKTIDRLGIDAVRKIVE